MLNEQQIDAIDKIYNFFTDDEGGEYLLKGSAGTGKTYTVKYILKQLENGTEDYKDYEDYEEEDVDINDRYYDIINNENENDNETETDVENIYSKQTITFCAPTHKALKVLKKSILNFKSDNKFFFRFITTSKLLDKHRKKYERGDDIDKLEFISSGINQDTGEIKKNYIEEKKIEEIIEAGKIDYDDYIKNFSFDKKKKLYFTTPFHSSINKNGIYIIDECSMIGNKDYSIMKQLVDIYNLKILFIGDSAQLGPIVKNKNKNIMKMSKTFRIKNMSVLHKTERASSKNLYSIYSKFRQIVYNPDINFKEHIYQYLNKKTDYLIVLNDKRKFLNEIKKSIINMDNMCVLSHTNKMVDMYNKEIKKIVSPNSTGDWSVGDRIIFNKPYKSSTKLCEGIKCGNKWQHWPCNFVNNNDMGYVIEVDTVIHCDLENFFNLCKTKKGKEKSPILIYKLKIKLEDYGCPLGDAITTTVYKISKKDRDKYLTGLRERKNKMISEIENSNMSDKDIKYYLETLNKKKNNIDSPIKRAYAISTTKSQGSTYEKIFIDTTDLDWCKMSPSDKAHNLYTAVTRASSKIYMLVKFVKSDRNNENLNKDFLKKCSRCHSEKQIINFVRKSGSTKKTCNNCSAGQKRIRKENNIK